MGQSQRLCRSIDSTPTTVEYRRLKIKFRFDDWTRRHIEKYGFAENQDYVRFSPKPGETSQGGRPSIDYHVSFDMAKELGMVAGTRHMWRTPRFCGVGRTALWRMSLPGRTKKSQDSDWCRVWRDRRPSYSASPNIASTSRSASASSLSASMASSGVSKISPSHLYRAILAFVQGRAFSLLPAGHPELGPGVFAL